MKNAADRATDLLIDRITEGLDPERGRELDALLQECPELDVESFELAAAAIELTVIPTSEPLPEGLRGELSKQAAEFFQEPAKSSTDSPTTIRSTTIRSAAGHAGIEKRTHAGIESRADGGALVQGDFQRSARSARRDAFAGSGWLAAAAILILSITFWPRAVKELSPTEMSTAGARAEMIAQAGDLLRLEWTRTEDPAALGASGEVIWSAAEQRGYMTFRGLPVNDPAASQYQLWIFDSEQDERYPVDGGVFDIDSTGEVVVEIDAKLEIKDPTLFAITIEKPGGVVVSSRERLPLLAQVG